VVGFVGIDPRLVATQDSRVQTGTTVCTVDAFGSTKISSAAI